MAAAVERWQRLGLWVISRGEERYPERLRRALRSAAPALLYGAGDVARLGLGGLAVVGSRDIDEEGLSFTRRVAQRCAGAGIQIVSGGARGVDQASVTAALEAGGGAVAVLADRLDRVATSREAKEPLRCGLLTLVSPYEPEASFAVGRAMGRNKHIYALADFALVVRFTTGEGGTWAGVVEQLGGTKPGLIRSPVFIRLAHNPEDGCWELQRRGALPFPEEDFRMGSVTEILNRAASRPDQSQRAPPPATAEQLSGPEASALSCPETSPAPSTAATAAPAVTEVDTCYHRCLPLLLQHLREEAGKKQLSEIAKRLELVPGQLDEWLKRAIREGKVTKTTKKRRVVYMSASPGEEQTLFDRDGDAA
jgi:predicted Rossmann fold nucleotide-binding protein DprA/Smf involved in DNA uptake